VGLVFALILIRKVVGADAGNEKMHAIASAIQQGAKAYLNRQIFAVSLIAVVIFAGDLVSA
jgi:K(+)-stimulated pyrophosphate-energized sodium pump